MADKIQDLSDHALELIAARFKALSEPNRLKLIIALEQGDCNVSELVESTGMAQPNVSRHLQTLIEAGILARRRAGTAVVYSIADPAIFELCERVCGGVRKQVEYRAGAFGSRAPGTAKTRRAG